MVQEEKQQHMLEEAQKNYGNDIKIVSAEKNILHFMTDIQSITYTCHNNGKIDKTVRWRRGHKPSAPIVNEDKITKRKPDNESDSLSIHKNESETDKKTGKHDGMHQLTFEDILNESDQNNNRAKAVNEEQSGAPDQKVKKQPLKKKKNAKNTEQDDKPVDAIDDFMPVPVSESQIDILNNKQAETVKKKRHKRAKDKIEINADTENTKNQIIKGVNSNKSRVNTPLNNKKTATNGSDEKVTFTHETPCPFKRGDSVESRYSGKAYTVLSTLGNTARVIASDPKTEYMEFTICAADLKPSTHKARMLEE